MRVLLVAFDYGSYINEFPLALAYVASIIRQEGHEPVVYNQDVHHYSDEQLTDYLDQNEFDVIGISLIAGYYEYKKIIRLSQAINNSRNRPFFIIGGHGPSPEPEFFLKKTGADVAVIGEGEETIAELLKAIENKSDLKTIKGIAYRDGDKFYKTPARPLIADIDSIPLPAYDLFPIEYYRLIRMPHSANSDFVLPVLSGRGCTFKCNFCYRMDKGFRGHSAERLIEEIRYLQKNWGINYIAFYDELLMSSMKRTVELCEAFIASGLKFKWTCNGRLNYAKPKVLKLMKQAGCVFINYGIEAMDNQILKNMKKVLTTEQIITGIENTLAEEISPGYNIIFGNIGEDLGTLQKGVDFLLKYDDGSQLRTIRPVTPYPGSPLYYEAIQRGLLEGPEDFYEKKHLNSDLIAVNFTDISDEEAYRGLYDANLSLLNNYFNNKSSQMKNVCHDLYINKNKNFRGFRQT